MALAILARRGKLKRRERWSRERLDQFQQRELLRLRAYAYARSPFYMDFHKGLFDAPLQSLPVLKKSTLMGNFDRFVTDRGSAS
jgi:phenylacetate-CoA ligase